MYINAPPHATHICTVSSSDTLINHVNLHGDTIYTITPPVPNVLLHRAEAQRDLQKKGEREVNTGRGIQGDWKGEAALWTFCSFDRPLRKHSVLPDAGTGRLHLERYQVLKNKGMCFPFAADLSAEVF